MSTATAHARRHDRRPSRRSGSSSAGSTAWATSRARSPPSPTGDAGPPLGILVLGRSSASWAWSLGAGLARQPGRAAVAAGAIIVSTLTGLPAFFVDVPMCDQGTRRVRVVVPHGRRRGADVLRSAPGRRTGGAAMIAVVTILLAFPLGFFVSSRLAAMTTYAVAYLWAFTFQTLYLMLDSWRARTRRSRPATSPGSTAWSRWRSSWSASGWSSWATGRSRGRARRGRHQRDGDEREERRQRERRAVPGVGDGQAGQRRVRRRRRGTGRCSARPRARPDQNGPARSATAVNARPLSATVTSVATTTSEHGDREVERGGQAEQRHRRGGGQGDPAQRAHPAADDVGQAARPRSGRARRRPGRRRRAPPAAAG